MQSWEEEQDVEGIYIELYVTNSIATVIKKICNLSESVTGGAWGKSWQS